MINAVTDVAQPNLTRRRTDDLQEDEGSEGDEVDHDRNERHRERMMVVLLKSSSAIRVHIIIGCIVVGTKDTLRSLAPPHRQCEY